MQYEKGDIVAGTVTGITNYGIFVQLDAKASGLVHISEISPYFVRNIEHFVRLGEVIRVQIVEELEKQKKYCLTIKGLDYRILYQRKSKIKETKLGFSTLALSLNKWIEESYEKVEKITAKN